jgi:hypothetical protein
MGNDFAGWSKEDFVECLHEHHPEPLSARKGASWVFEMRFTHPTDMLLLTGEGFVYEFTTSGGYEECIEALADELADLADEPPAKLEIRVFPGRRRRRISRRGYPPQK